MFKKLFSKKTKAEILQQEYQKLQHESYKLSTVNRAKSDQKMAEAQAKLDELRSLEKAQE